MALSTTLNRAVQFADKIRTGENLKRHDPAYKLREYLINNVNAGGSASLEDYKLAVTACVADALGEDISSFRPSSSWDELPKRLKRYSVRDNSKEEIKVPRAAA